MQPETAAICLAKHIQQTPAIVLQLMAEHARFSAADHKQAQAFAQVHAEPTLLKILAIDTASLTCHLYVRAVSHERAGN